MTAKQYVTMEDGCRIACEFRPRPEASVLVCSPSLGTTMHLFDAQVAALGDRFGILRYDPRGHGGSDVPAGSYSLDRLGRDVVQLLDAFAIAQAHFIGVSLGGMTGQWLGYRAPERLHSLTLANTSAYMGPPSGWAERIAVVLDKGMEPMVEPVIERWFTPHFRKQSPADVARISTMLQATDPLGYAGCCAAIRDMDMRAILELVRCPTLVIGGSHDPATPPEHAELLGRAIPAATLANLDAAHLSNIEQATAFNALLTEFLGASAPGQGVEGG